MANFSDCHDQFPVGTDQSSTTRPGTRTGDAFTFASQVPHGYRNVSDVVAKVLWVNSPATF